MSDACLSRISAKPDKDHLQTFALWLVTKKKKAALRTRLSNASLCVCVCVFLFRCILFIHGFAIYCSDNLLYIFKCGLHIHEKDFVQDASLLANAPHQYFEPISRKVMTCEEDAICNKRLLKWYDVKAFGYIVCHQ